MPPARGGGGCLWVAPGTAPSTVGDVIGPRELCGVEVPTAPGGDRRQPSPSLLRPEERGPPAQSLARRLPSLQSQAHREPSSMGSCGAGAGQEILPVMRPSGTGGGRDPGVCGGSGDETPAWSRGVGDTTEMKAGPGLRTGTALNIAMGGRAWTPPTEPGPRQGAHRPAGRGLGSPSPTHPSPGQALSGEGSKGSGKAPPHNVRAPASIRGGWGQSKPDVGATQKC